jgi:predicted nucleic acid-binding Zn ribbon protein
MALIQCRECGKMVSEEADICPYCGAHMPSHKRKQRRRYITIVVVILALIGVGLVYYRVSKVFAPPVTLDANGTPVNTTPAVPKLKQADPIKPQIIQKDYKEKIREMLDSGESVHAISKQTGIRIDEVRRIKKEKAEK